MSNIFLNLFYIFDNHLVLPLILLPSLLGFPLDKGGEALAQAAQRGGGCPIPTDTQCEAGQGPEQPALPVGVPVHCTAVGLGDL